MNVLFHILNECIPVPAYESLAIDVFLTSRCGILNMNFDIKNIHRLKVGQIIFIIDLYDEAYSKFKKNQHIVSLEFEKEFKTRAFLICLNRGNHDYLYGFELRTKKPRHNLFLELLKINRSKTYVDLKNLVSVNKYCVINTNTINKFFELSNSEFKIIARKILNEFSKEAFTRR